jgi:hypothetical protein
MHILDCALRKHQTRSLEQIHLGLSKIYRFEHFPSEWNGNENEMHFVWINEIETELILTSLF